MFNDRKALELTFEWYKNYYDKKLRKNLLIYHLIRLKNLNQNIEFKSCYYQFVYPPLTGLRIC